MSTTTRTVIRTHNPILATTLRAIAVCWWALAADFAHGLVGITRLLWAGYLQARREQLEFDLANPVTQYPNGDTQPPPQTAIEAVAVEIGQPAWLWVAVMSFIVAVALIDMVGAWPLRIDAFFTLLRG